MMRLARSLLAPMVALLAIASPALAQMRQTDGEGHAQPASPAMANSGKFGVVLISTTEPGKLVEQWAKPDVGIAVKTQTTATRNQPIVTFVVFGGCEPRADGNCDVASMVEILDPSGKPYEGVGPRAYPVWQDRPPVAPNIQLSRYGVGMRVENGEALGDYTVRVTVTDNVAHVSVSARQVLTITEAK